MNTKNKHSHAGQEVCDTALRKELDAIETFSFHLQSEVLAVDKDSNILIKGSIYPEETELNANNGTTGGCLTIDCVICIPHNTYITLHKVFLKRKKGFYIQNGTYDTCDLIGFVDVTEWRFLKTVDLVVNVFDEDATHEEMTNGRLERVAMILFVSGKLDGVHINSTYRNKLKLKVTNHIS